MSFFKNKPVRLTATVVLAAVVLACISHFGGGWPARVAGTVITPVEKLFVKLISPVADFRDNVLGADNLRTENEELKLQVDELLAENRSAEAYIEENKRLRELLQLKEQMTDKEVLAAEVIAADWDNFSETVTINRGSSDGVSLEDAVVSNLGVIGRVTEVGAEWSRVTTVLSPKHSLGVKVTRTGDLAVAEGEIKLAKDNKLRLGYISGAAGLIVGDIVETSGIGGVYPPGLVVGKISEIRMDNSGAVNYAVVEPTADFAKLYEVLVITDWSRKNVEPDYVYAPPEVQQENISEITDEEIENAEG